jgi:5,10-methylenetetrahydromethanopterin reductase
MTMRIGLLIAGRRSAAEAVSVARAAEQAGVAEIWLSEDYFENGAFVVAAAVAGATARANVGLGVINPWTRHPMLIAMEFASLRELIPGRAILGLGASNRGWMQDHCGIPFRAPVAVLREATQIIRGALDGERVTFSGQHFTVDAQLAHPQSEPTRIYLGVKASHMMTMAAKHADGVVLSVMTSPGYVRWVRDKVGLGVDISAYIMAACGAGVRAEMGRRVASYLGIHGVHDITIQGGLDPDTARRFQEARVMGRSADSYVTDEIVDTFAIAGDFDTCFAGLDRLAQAGLDSAILLDPGDDTVEGLLSTASAYQRRQPVTAEERTGKR